MEFFSYPFPVGFHETARWTTALAHWCGRDDEAARIITEAGQQYWQQISCARKHLQGRRLMVVTDRECMGWVSDLCGDLGMVIAGVYLMNNPGKPLSGEPNRPDLPVYKFSTLQSVTEEITKAQPDLVLSTLPLPEMPEVCHDMLPLHPDVGFMAGLPLAYRWSHIIRLPAMDGWRRDGGCVH
jgi:nitrogenase molybdenum-iron protein alpha/beta subunit